MIRRPPRSTLFPLHDALPIWSDARRALRRGPRRVGLFARGDRQAREGGRDPGACMSAEEILFQIGDDGIAWLTFRSEEHTSELQSRSDIVCRLLLEKQKMQGD